MKRNESDVAVLGGELGVSWTAGRVWVLCAASHEQTLPFLLVVCTREDSQEDEQCTEKCEMTVADVD
jgi:hypothetical protein